MLLHESKGSTPIFVLVKFCGCSLRLRCLISIGDKVPVNDTSTMRTYMYLYE